MPALRNGLAALLFVVVAWPVLAQQQPQGSVRVNYLLGPNDQILIRAPEAPEIDQRPFRIDRDGNIDLPLVGRIHAAGRTLEELEADLAGRLREYLREPHVFVDIVQFRRTPGDPVK
jgi:polysaccharide export outer membrane protein